MVDVQPPRRALNLPRGRLDLLRQLAIWSGFALGYQLARGLANQGAASSIPNGEALVRLERHLHALFEPGLQRSLIDVAVLVRAANWTYWLSQFLVVCLVLLWIYLRRYPAYLPVRNTLIVTNTIGLAGYVFFPSAPPRLLPTLDIVDTLATSGSLSHATGLVELAENPYAAMPSLHAADGLIIGAAMAVLVRPLALKVLWALWPAWVSFSLILTGNHFWIDIAAGVLLVAVSVPIVAALERGRGHRSFPARASVRPPMSPEHPSATVISKDSSWSAPHSVRR